MSTEEEKLQELSVIFNISMEGFKQLQGYGIDLNHLFVLECLSEDVDIAAYIPPSREAAWKQNLFRKGFLTDIGKVSTSGFELLQSLKKSGSVGSSIKKVKERIHTEFETWWKCYPPTNSFEYKGKKFLGSRVLRVKKDECRSKFTQILEEGEYSIDSLIKALHQEITAKMETSIMQNTNEMKYMQNSLTYLNQRTFENFMGKDIQANNTSQAMDV